MRMAVFECESCGRIMECGLDHSRHKGAIRCVCGARMLRRPDSAPNEMRDMDNELGRDE
jgi:DNA-directed RNA polymerase subunit RPC12/RpoP